MASVDPLSTPWFKSTSYCELHKDLGLTKCMQNAGTHPEKSASRTMGHCQSSTCFLGREDRQGWLARPKSHERSHRLLPLPNPSNDYVIKGQSAYGEVSRLATEAGPKSGCLPASSSVMRARTGGRAERHAQTSAVRSGTVRYGMVRYGKVWYGPVR